MPRLPDVMNFVAWLAALWWAGASVVLLLGVSHPSVSLALTTRLYLGGTVLMGIAAFVALGWDKRRASRGGRRIPEVLLHGMELLGGWPGSLIGQRTFRHKTRKVSYQAVFWTIAAAHLALLAWMAWLAWRGETTGEPVARGACPRGVVAVTITMCSAAESVM